MTKFGFASIFYYIWLRLNNTSTTTSINPYYISFYFDTMTNISVTHSDPEIVLLRGLIASSDDPNSLEVRCQNDFNLLGSINIK